MNPIRNEELLAVGMPDILCLLYLGAVELDGGLGSWSLDPEDKSSDVSKRRQRSLIVERRGKSLDDCRDAAMSSSSEENVSTCVRTGHTRAYRDGTWRLEKRHQN